MGGKAKSLERLQRAGFRVPPFFVAPPAEEIDATRLAEGCERLCGGDSHARFAVRSSAEAEDSATSSYAGIFESFLFVEASQIADRVSRVRTSGRSERVKSYDAVHGARIAHVPGAIVQIMIDADVSGVAFGRDPVDGSDRVVVTASYGLGTGVVGGDCDADTYRVADDGRIERCIAHKTTAHRRAESLAGVSTIAVPKALMDAPALTDAQLRAVVELTQAAGALFGAPQDIEWAIGAGHLYVLQSRPITTTAIIWDNSNIAESYGGLVSPLTFSFARYAYAGAYRQFMRVLGIQEKTIAANEDAVENMLGLVAGRMYYNLLNWYRLLALVPGFRLNRKFMEAMMGVGEALPEQTVRAIERSGKARDLRAVTKMILALVYRFITLSAEIRRFHQRIAHQLSRTPPLASLNAGELCAEFERLEASLLSNWQAPLVNDFFAMVFHGVLRRLTAEWCGDTDGTLHNDLLCAGGGMISTEPARRIAALAELARRDAPLVAAMEFADSGQAEAEIGSRPSMAAAYASYLERFGDRCQNELKLESLTLHHDPLPLIRAIAHLAREPRREECASSTATSLRRSAEQRIAHALRRRLLRRIVFDFVVRQARNRIRDRENLRFERTRVFARVRDIFLEIGLRLHEGGELEDSRDVFLLEIGEVRAAIEKPAAFETLRLQIAERRDLYDAYAVRPAPPTRFTSIGTEAPPTLELPSPEGDAWVRTGIGCCPGVVRARVRVVKNPQSPLEAGEILVAERTDPGWIVLFTAASGILVERGSLLSHAAIVSREMGIPSVVSIPGLSAWLHDGDLVEFDGRTGTVRLLEPAQAP